MLKRKSIYLLNLYVHNLTADLPATTWEIYLLVLFILSVPVIRKEQTEGSVIIEVIKTKKKKADIVPVLNWLSTMP